MKVSETGLIVAHVLVLIAAVGVRGETLPSLSAPRIARADSLYEEGRYAVAIDSFSAVIEGGLTHDGGPKVFQRLGCSYAQLGQLDKAKESFAAGIAKYPDMVIDTLEVPPAIVLIFKQAALEKKLVEADSTRFATRLPTVAQRRENRAGAFALLGASLVSAGAGGYFLSMGHTYYRDYRSVAVPDQNLIDRYYNQSMIAYVEGAVLSAIAVTGLSISIYLFKKHRRSLSATLSLVTPGAIRIVACF